MLAFIFQTTTVIISIYVGTLISRLLNKEGLNKYELSLTVFWSIFLVVWAVGAIYVSI